MLADGVLGRVRVPSLDRPHDLPVLGDRVATDLGRQRHLVHRFRDRVEREDERPEHPVPAGLGDGGVEVHIEVGDVGIVDRGVLLDLHDAVEVGDIVRGPLHGRESRGGDLEQFTDVSDILGGGVPDLDEDLHRFADQRTQRLHVDALDEASTALPGGLLDQAEFTEGSEGFAHRASRHTEPLRQDGLARQSVPITQLTGDDGTAKLLLDLLPGSVHRLRLEGHRTPPLIAMTLAVSASRARTGTLTGSDSLERRPIGGRSRSRVMVRVVILFRFREDVDREECTRIYLEEHPDVVRAVLPDVRRYVQGLPLKYRSDDFTWDGCSEAVVRRRRGVQASVQDRTAR